MDVTRTMLRSVRKIFRLDESTPILRPGVRLGGSQDGSELGGSDGPCPMGRTWMVDTAVMKEGDVGLLTQPFPGLMVRVAGNSTY